ncbi:Gfo/Idh/MocA family oxidoreductase [Enterococcus faecium]|nr:Gfo/Idh/MocA family oxidoreductase [Enterococcus faecium]EKG9126541.1 Gfo/Idh/MocA family oxidoreductase [Enterococcus faecium]
MKKIRIGIIGIGNIGSFHMQNVLGGELENAELVALCDINYEKLTKVEKQYGDRFKLYDHVDKLLADSEVDAIIISTPHYDHPVIAIQGLQAGKHILVEKPVGVYTKKVLEMIEESKKHPELTLAVVYNQRMNPTYQKAKELVESGQIGELRRTNWIITNWYRSQSYYNSGGWRATWRGEGGGVLLNQDPHQLDLLQWICGMPQRIYSFAYNGKRRDVEVETEVTAYFEYANGATGVFVTTTTETPGTNRFEIVGSQGKIVIEDEKLKYWRTVMDEAKWNETYTGGFGEPEVWEIKIPVVFDSATGHLRATQNFVNNILFGEKLLAPATDGIYGLSISNAIHLSSWLERWIDLPIDEDLFLEELNKRITNSEDKIVEEKVLSTKNTY